MKYARIEYERRFLFTRMPTELDPAAGFTRIIDRYLRDSNLRLRRMETPTGALLACKLAKKYQPAGSEPYESTITNLYLSAQEYALFEGIEAFLLLKKRYPFHVDGLTYSIDAFEGELEGLLIGEIEAQDPKILLAYPYPPGAVMEVTADPFFLGGHLVRMTRRELEKRLGALR